MVIYSMASSSAEDAPRGMEFLYDLHRLNVATSRARCLAILVASPELIRVFCTTPRQMVLANALCRFGSSQSRSSVTKCDEAGGLAREALHPTSHLKPI